MANKMTPTQLASKLWDSANELRKNFDSKKYKDIILSLIFYKFLSQTIIDWFWENEGITYEEIKEFDNSPDENIQKLILDEKGYYIPYKFLFHTWINNSSEDEKLSIDLFNSALASFDKSVQDTQDDNFIQLYDGILKPLKDNYEQTTVSDKRATENNLKQLIKKIDEIPTGKQDYDLLGYIYEYFIGKFASTSAKEDGQYYTPHEVSDLMSEIISNHLKDRKEISIYDPTSGSGSLLLNIGKTYQKMTGNENNITYYAQDVLQEAYTTTRMNLLMSGIEPSKIHVSMGDTLKRDWPFIKDKITDMNTSQKLDAVISNPPYSLNWDPENAANDPRFINYGLAPKSKADFAFLLHSYHHLDTDGIMAIVLPHGVLFRGNSEKSIREQLIKNHAIDTIIGLPDNMFFNTNISTIIMILKKDQKETDGSIQFIDASQLYEKKDKFKKFNVSHIKKISHAIINKTNIENFSRVVSLEEIEANDYNLNISRYIENFETPKEFDLFASLNAKIPQKEIDEFSQFWNIFPNLKNKIFNQDLEHKNYSIFKDVDSLDSLILEDEEVKNYLNDFNDNLSNLKEFIKSRFSNLHTFATVEKFKFQKEFDDLFFRSYNHLDLIDKYELYQIIHQINDTVLDDVQILSEFNVTDNFAKNNQDEIFEDIEKKSKKDENKTILKKEFLINQFFLDKQQEIEELNAQKEELASEISELKDSKTENDSDEDISKINKEIKALDAQAKKIKTTIDTLTNEITNNLNEKIQNLTNEEFLNLLYVKWTETSFTKISNKVDEILNEFISNLKNLYDKYNETMSDLDAQIKENEKELSSLLKELKAENESDALAIEELIKLLEGK
ncbi:type I restriction-modification system subunit M [Mycoplasma zalophi]|nr:type I restriction-modification system subunit M [Mycoplasma zalophi]MBU4691359.1 type I restriction-modification system subunit M [Mycoplasma zalophi]